MSNRRKVRELLEEKGISLPLVAMSLFLLMSLAAFAIDLGWFYVNSQRVQRAADAAALAGVVHLPTSEANAIAAAVEVGTNNAYADQPGDETSGAYPQLVATKIDATQLKVQIYDEVPTFFLKVLGMNTQLITEYAIAEFVPPLKLGSPGNSFGNGCDPRQAGCVGQPNFWANIHGRDTDTRMGDAYSSRCNDGETSGNAGCVVNPSFSRVLTTNAYDGYLYGIEANGEGSITIQFIDIAFRNRSGGQTTSDAIRTGDRACEAGAWGNSAAPDCGPDVQVTLYAPDETTLDLSDAVALCTHTFTPIPQTNDFSTASYVWQAPPGGCWTQAGPGIGTYVLQVRLVNAAGNQAGLNRYSVRVTSPGGNAKLFGLRDMSIYNNFQGSSSLFYLAEMTPVYAGKTFVIELYDPGEVPLNTDNFIQLMDPTDTGDGIADTCEVYWKDAEGDAWQSLGTHSPCSVNARRANNNDRYQDDWMKIEYEVPDTYTCAGALGCWWRIRYNYAGAGSVNDTTTWRAYVIGNPIHLIRG